MDRIKEIIKCHCLKEVQEEDELLKSHLLNSFQLLEVICELEDAYQVELSPEDIGNMDNFSSIKRIRDLISRKTELEYNILNREGEIGDDCAGNIRSVS